MPAVERELRYAVTPITGIEVRDSGTPGAITLTGYAAVTEQETTLYDTRFYRLKEVITRGAFGPALARTGLDVHLNIGHDMNRVIARTGVNGIGRLELTEDETGLRMWARLDATDPDVMALAPKMRAGIIDQASFAFTVARDQLITRDTTGVEEELRRIDEIGDLFDVTVCARGAYPQTSATLRSLMAAAGRAGTNPAGTDIAHTVDVETGHDAPAVNPADEFILNRDREAYELRLRLARTKRMN